MTKHKLLPILVLSAASQLSLAEQVCQTDTIEATTPTSRFLVNDTGTVTDVKNGLMWRRCVEGTSGEDCSQGSPTEHTWAGALLYVPGFNSEDGFAGHNNWRLPNVRELSTLVELQCANPAINVEVFPGAPASHVWTSSPYNFYTHYSWYVDFTNGAPTYNDRMDKKHLRLVRDLP